MVKARFSSSFSDSFYKGPSSDSRVSDDSEKSESLKLLEKIQSRLKDNVTPKFGSEVDIKKRAEILDGIKELRKIFEQMKPAHGNLGHNSSLLSPSEENKIISEIQATVDTINDEIKKSHAQPDLNKVTESARSILKINSWVSEKLNIGVDDFMKGLGRRLGERVGDAIFITILFILANIFYDILIWLDRLFSVF